MKNSYKVGTLTCVHSSYYDGHCDHLNFFFETDTKVPETYPVVFEKKHFLSDTPLNTKIALLGHLEDGKYVVADTIDFYQKVQDEFAYINETTKNILLIRQVRLSSTEEWMEEELERCQQYGRELENYVRAHSERHWTCTVKVAMVRNEESPHPPWYLGNLHERLAEEVAVPDFEYNYIHIIGGGSQGVCGQATLRGNKAVTYATCPTKPKTIIHEQYHNFGLHHAATKIADVYKEYGDQLCVMGTGTGSIHSLGSKNYETLGLDKECKIRRIDSSTQLHLVPTDLNPACLHPHEDQAINLPGIRTISVRSSKSRYPVSHNVRNHVHIHTEDQDGRTIKLLPSLSPGEGIRDRHGYKFEYLEFDDEWQVAKINVYIGDDMTVPNDIPISNEFPHVEAIETQKAHMGFWVNWRTPGEGYVIVIDNNRVTVYWYTFNNTNGSTRWYFGSYLLTDGPETFNLYTAEIDDWKNLESANVTKAGIARFYCLDDTHAVFDYNTKEHGRGREEIKPLRLTNHKMNGPWASDDHPNEGFLFQGFDNTCVGYFYTYGPTPYKYPYPTPSGVHTQRWFQFAGERGEDGSYPLTVRTVRGGQFRSYRKVEEKDIGSGVLTYDPIKDIIKISYNFDDKTGCVRSENYTLRRVA